MQDNHPSRPAHLAGFAQHLSAAQAHAWASVDAMPSPKAAPIAPGA